jgi:hypothetical protein
MFIVIREKEELAIYAIRKMSPEDRAVFQRAQARLTGAKDDLWIATSTQEVLDWRVKQRMEWALGRLRESQQKYGEVREVRVEGLPPEQSLPGALPYWLIDLWKVDLNKATPDDLKKDAMRNRRFVQLGDCVFLVLGWGVAVVTAMWALYAGKSFGTGWDYLGAILWGSGVDTGLRGLSNVLAKLKVPQPGK